MLKYATPQQMQLVSQQVQQNPNSPEALAAAMAAQFQQQLRAPNPQAPQQTVLQQKLQEFQQTSQQGLPQVGGNQMAMQQAAQQDPMRNAGIGAAPENQQEQAPQEQAPQEQAPQEAATGGLVALAHGGEVSHFANGGGLGSLAKYLSQGEEDPNKFDSAELNIASMLNGDDEPIQKTKLAPIGIDDIVSSAKPTSSAARNEAAPTYRERQDAIKELLGAPEDYSEEIEMAKEDVRSANKEKWGGALAQGIGAYLSAPTQYQSRALGAGLLSGVSGYQSGAKDEAAAEKEQRALRTAQKTSELQGHKTAASMYLAQQAKVAEAEAEARAKREETMLGIQGNLGLERVRGANSMQELKTKMANEQAIQVMKDMSEMERKQFEAGVLSADKIAEVVGRSMQGGSDPKETQAAVNNLLEIMRHYKMGGGSSSQPFNSLGNGFGISKGQ
jgi:hypothetical protein